MFKNTTVDAHARETEVSETTPGLRWVLRAKGAEFEAEGESIVIQEVSIP